MRTVGLMVGLVVLAAPAWADDNYRWTGAAGNVHDSNTTSGKNGPTRIDSTPSAPAAAPAADAQAVADPDAAARAPAGDADGFSAGASLRRNALERDLRNTEKRIRELDAKLAGLARARGQHAKGSAATGGVGTIALDVRSDEEKALTVERDQLAQHGADVRNDAARLRQEVTARLGSTPAWWIDVR